MSTLMSSPGGESPVLRSSQLRDDTAPNPHSTLVGLGIGLGAPFSFPSEKYQFIDVDFNMGFLPSPDDEDSLEVEDVLTLSGLPGLVRQPLQRAHSSVDATDSDTLHAQNTYELSAPPMKRRRTIDTRG